AVDKELKQKPVAVSLLFCLNGKPYAELGQKRALRVYQPEIVRYLFAGTRPNTEFVISFDLDVIKIYEDYDKTERIYWGIEKARNEEVEALERRIYELSQVNGVPEEMPYQIPFRHLCNLLQIHQGNIDRVVSLLPGLKPSQEERVRRRAQCAWYWITECAPEDFRFFLRSGDQQIQLQESERAALRHLRDEVVARLDEFADETKISEAIYAVAQSNGMEPKQLFKAAYQALIGKDQGPRLAGFLTAIGKEKVLSILAQY
ncbi:MAG: lysine--tRNA ligase, partial [Rectinema sp.]|nr:lysine--tRNA ligase [Rectinema sp.]